MTIGVITAMESEYTRVAELLNGCTEHKIGAFTYSTGSMNGNKIILMQSGIGKVNAAIGAVELIHNFAPECIISSGVAGGIDSSLSVMDSVVSSHIVYHDVWCGEGNEYGQVQGLPAIFEGNTQLVKLAKSISHTHNIHAGMICSGDQFITNRDELNKIKQNFPQGLAVDMESGAIAQTCHLYNTPFVSFRVISDTPGAENHSEQYANFWGEIANSSFCVTKIFLKSIPSDSQWLSI